MVISMWLDMFHQENNRDEGVICLLEDLNVVGLKLQNAKFTRFKGDDHLIALRIDRGLVSQERDDAFSNLT